MKRSLVKAGWRHCKDGSRVNILCDERAWKSGSYWYYTTRYWEKDGLMPLRNRSFYKVVKMFQVRFVGYAQFVCHQPGWIGRVQI